MFPPLVRTIITLWFLAPGAAEDLFSGFREGWQSHWTERGLAERPNAFRLEETEDGRFLRVESTGTASALVRRVDVDTADRPVLSWRWKITRSLVHIEDERVREGDDYAARVAVMFDGEPFERGTSFLMYVWAGSGAVGDVYPSPYARTAATFVLQSGDARSGDWVLEERDLVSDFERYFGRKAQRVTGVALLVDTDNTDSEATSWFDDLTLERR